jgi:hypothetical protein
VPEPKTTALARKYKLQIDTSGVPTWTTVMGIVEFKPGLSPNLEDDGSYDDEGWGSQTKTGLDWTVEAKVKRAHDPDDVTVYDVGQEAIRTASELFGADGVVHVRWYDRFGGPEAYEGYAEVTWAPDGGKRTDLEFVQVTLTGKGERSVIANPEADPTPVSTVTALSDQTGAAAGGEMVILTGEHFVGVTSVKFGATSATMYSVESPTRIVAVSPAHAAGTVNVTVVTPAGTSATGAANSYVYS